jgi:hypothetical protein
MSHAKRFRGSIFFAAHAARSTRSRGRRGARGRLFRRGGRTQFHWFELESLEERCLLSVPAEQWLVVINGISPATTLDDQAQAGATLLQVNGIVDADVHVVQALDLTGSFLVETPADVTQATLSKELQDVPGLALVQAYQDDGGDSAPTEPPVLEDDEGDGGDLIDRDFYDQTFGPFNYDDFLSKQANGEVPDQSGPVDSPAAPADVLTNNNAGSSSTAFFTQSETTVVAFGTTVLTGFNDSGSSAGGSNKFTGFARSTDGGNTFTDGGTLPTNANGDAGDPVLALNSSTGRIYFATLQFSNSGEDVFHSDNGGVTWSAPAQGAPGKTSGLQDKEWIAVDNYSGSGNGNVYLVERDFGAGNGIYFYSSTDNGATFGPTGGTLIAAAGSGNVQGAFVAVGPDHSVSVFYLDNTTSTQFIKVRKSTDQGVTFGAPVTVATLSTTSTNGDLGLTGLRQGDITASGFRSNSFPHAAVNPVNGNIYVTYNSKGAPPDKADIFLVQSTDGGATWSAPVKVNDDSTSTDQWQPTIAVTPDGTRLGIFYYSRQDDPNDNLFRYYGRLATISGSTVAFGPSFAVSDTPSLPEFGRDSVVNSVYMGDYNTAFATASGFDVTWSDNRSDLSGGGLRKDPNVEFKQIPLSLFVISTVPAVSGAVSSVPVDYVVNFSDPIDTATVDASDFQVTDDTITPLPADSFVVNSPTRVTFHYNAAPFSTEGLHTMTMAAASVLRSSDGSPLGSFSGSFRYDVTPLAVTSTTPAAGGGGAFTLPSPLTYVVNFNEPVAAGSVGTDDLSLSTGSVTSAVANGSQVTYTIGGILTSSLGTLTIVLGAGKVTDNAGNPNPTAFTSTYLLTPVTTAFPTPLSPLYPLGSLVYQGSTTANIRFVGDTDKFTLPVDPGQTITVLVTPTSPGLQPTVQLADPSSTSLGTATASAAGKAAMLQSIATTTSGTYTLTVGGAASTVGNYTVQIYLNAAVEAEGKVAGVDDNSVTTAQDISGSFAPISTSQAATRGGVLGQTDTAATATATAVPLSFTDISGTGTTVLSGGDDVAVSANIGFTFNLFGTNFTSLFISSNGLITFGSANTAFTNATLSANPSQAAIAPFWDDLVVSNSFGTARVLTQLIGTVGSRQFIIEWNKVTFFSGGVSSDPITFEAVLSEGSNNIQFNYLDLVSGSASGNNGGSATAGIKAANPTAGSFVELINNNGPNAFVGTGLSTLITPSPPTADYYKFTLNAGDTATLALTGQSSGNLALQLRDASDTTLATGTGGATNVTQVINNFVATGGTYYARITGNPNVPYSLLVTRNAAFDTEPNDSFATAQPIGTNSGALGAIVTPGLVPSWLGSIEGNTNNAFPFNVGTGSTMRYQQLYSHTEFGQAGTITAIRFRRDAGFSTFSSIINNVKINLGYAATTVATRSTIFANNVGAGTTTVFNGNLTLSSTGTGSPNPFDIVITLTTPFTYDPTQGDLLFDVTINSGASTTQFDASMSPQQSTTARVYAFSSTATTGSTDSFGLVTRFDMTGVTTSDDWYSINVNSTSNNLELVTTTPADGANQFVNTLNPHLELYSPTNSTTPVATGVALADGRNEFIQYLPPTTGTYVVHVTGENGTAGEYFLTTNDVTAPRVVATSLAPNAVVLPGTLTYQVTFSEPMRSSNLTSDDFTLRGNFRSVNYFPSSFSFNTTGVAPGTVLTLTYSNLPDDNYTLTLLSGTSGGLKFTDAAGNALDGEFSGSFPSGDGIAGGNFVIGFSMDPGTEAYPAPLTAQLPPGSLIYSNTLTRVIAFAVDTDAFTLGVDPGQTLSVLLNGTTAGLQPTVQLLDPSNNLLATAMAAAAGQPVFLNTSAVSAPGTYTITVGGAAGTTGLYTVQVILNAALEAENNGGVSNDTRATAQNIDPSFITLQTADASASRGAVLGGNSAGAWTDYYAFTAGADDVVSVALKHLTGSGANVFIEDQSGSLLASGSAGAANFDQGISSLSLPGAGTYYLRVSGALAATYSVVIVRNAAFDAEPNDSFATAQPIGGAQGALGNLESTTINFADSGWWDSTGGHTSTNKNYIAGKSGTTLFNDYFVFNLSGVTQTITGAQLRLSEASNGYNSPDPTETYSLFDVSTSIAALEATGSGQTAIFNDLGTGTTFGSRDISATDRNTVVTIGLNAAAIAALNATRGGQFALGGAVTTISGTSTQDVFGFSGNTTDVRQLVLTFAPEDWYSINVTGTSSNLRVATSTPADGPNQFVNTLNPHIELYDPTDTLVASGVALPDGRNESIEFHAPGVTPGTYRVRVMADNFATWGEYFLGATTLPDQAPIAADDPGISTKEDTPVAINVLQNDTDPDGTVDPTTVAVATPPAHGAVSIDPVTGQVTYTPSLNYSGPDSFTYTVKDDNGVASSPALVSLTVIAVADPPTLSVADATGDEGTPIPLSIVAALTDTDGSESLSIQVSGVPALAQLSAGINNGAGVWTLAPGDLNGLTISCPDNTSFSLAVTATSTESSNGDHASTSGTILVTVNNVAPKVTGLTPDSAINENDTFTLNGTFYDPGTLDTHTIVIAWGPGEGTTTLTTAGPNPAGTTLGSPLGDGHWNFSAIHQYLDDNPSGTPSDVYLVGVTITDKDNGVGTGSTSVTVNNVAPVVAPIQGPGFSPGVRGQTLSFSSSFTDVGTLDTHVVSWDFGDGTVIPFHSTTDAGALAPSHIYANSGNYVVTVTVEDDDLGITTVTKPITIAAVALEPDPGDPTKTALVVGGTPSNDTIVISPVGNTGSVSVSINGNVQGTFTPTGRIIAFGQAGDDDIQVAGGVRQEAMLFGGDGNDRLKAGDGASVLVGGSGNDQLIGGNGRNILIGGTGSDSLIGGADDDILIGGSTTDDANLGALAAILDEWSRTDRSFAIRQADLQNGGGLNGLYVLNDSTIIDDLAADILNGTSGNDWLILGVGDKKNGQ